MKTPFLEKRGAIWVEVGVKGRKVQVINTHLSLFPLEGMLQIKSLLGHEWLGSPACKGPVILCGDFNSLVNSRICKAVGRNYKSVYFHEPDIRRLKTFPSFFPLGLVDHIFLGKGIKAVKTEIPKTHLEKTASDHLPLTAEVVIEGGGRKNVQSSSVQRPTGKPDWRKAEGKKQSAGPGTRNPKLATRN
jgi:endonuclease/exonuclease/phosphatase family metal-dependent hydrolase